MSWRVSSDYRHWVADDDRATGLAAASIGALLRRLDPRRWGTGRPSARRLALIAAGAAVAVVALVGLLHPLPAAGGQPQATTYAVAAADRRLERVWTSAMRRPASTGWT